MPQLSIGLLGSLQILIADTPVRPLESVKVYALLAYLAVESDQPHTRESLVGLLWPDHPEESARHNLRQALFNLRKILDDKNANPTYLLIDRETIQFNRASDYSLDLAEFNRYFFTCEEHLSQCTPDCSIHASNLEKMVKLYRGEFLHGLNLDDSTEFEEWTLVQRESLHQRLLEAHSYLANYYELHGEYKTARSFAHQQLELDPWREEAHRQMMRLLVLDGERSAALAQYDNCRQVLAEELDVEPSTETRELYEQIRLGSIIPRSAKPSFETSLQHNLPIQLTPFIGREMEIEQVGKLLGDPACRCITLLGPGGIGKTRLALHVADDHSGKFKHGVTFVTLASVGSMPGVIPAITNAFKLTFYDPGELKTHLLNYLRDKQLLLLLDNLEQLLIGSSIEENIAQFMIEILMNAPGVKLLVTSREAVNVQGEWIFEVKGLEYPETEPAAVLDKYDAVALFVQRARRALPGFSLNEENKMAIARICRLVEGMPLAIELAATWMRALSPAEIAKEIEDNLDFLSSSMIDIPERHRSMRVVFEQSWKLLSRDEQKALARLSVFRGGFQRQAAEKVAGATLSLLSTLVNRTMLRRTAAGRYDLHELTRQYSAIQLAKSSSEKTETQKRHYEYYLSLAETSDHELKGRNQLDWLDKLEQEHDNLRAALEWALESDATVPGGYERALRLPAALRWFWRMRGHFHEGCDWLMESLHLCTECKTSARGRALLGLSLLTNAVGDLGNARQPADESVQIYRSIEDKEGLAEALMISGLTALWQGESDLGRTQTKEALEIYRSVKDKWGEAHALYRLGSYLSDYGGDTSGTRMLEESASILEELGEKYLYTSVLLSLGIVDLSHGDYAAAEQRFERCLIATRAIKHPWGIADALTNLGCLFRIRGEYAKARSYFDQSLQVYHEHGRNIWEADVLCALAENAIAQCDIPGAKIYLVEASEILGSSENKWLILLVAYFKGLLAYHEHEDEKAVGLINEAISLSREGQFMPDLARSVVTSGLVKIRLGDFEEAKHFLLEGLRLFWEFDHKLGIATALEAYAQLSAARGDFASAANHLAAGNTLRQRLGAVRPPIERSSYDNLITNCKNQLGGEIFNDLWSRAEIRPPGEVVEEILQADASI